MMLKILNLLGAKWSNNKLGDKNGPNNFFEISPKIFHNFLQKSWITWSKIMKWTHWNTLPSEIPSDTCSPLSMGKNKKFPIKSISKTMNCIYAWQPLAVFDYPKNLTLFDTECKKVLGSSLLVVRRDGKNR